jgi:hypothetical protein
VKVLLRQKAYLVIWCVDEGEGGLFLQRKVNLYGFRILKKGAHTGIVTVVGGFLPCFLQVSFELLDGLVKGSIVAETF